MLAPSTWPMHLTTRPPTTVSKTTYNRFCPYYNSSAGQNKYWLKLIKRAQAIISQKTDNVWDVGLWMIRLCQLFWTLPTNGSFSAFALNLALFRSQQQCLATMPAWWVLIRTKPVVGFLGHCCWWSCGKVQCLLQMAKKISTLLKMAVMNAG